MRNHIRKLLCVIVLLAMTVNGIATNYYCSPNGNGNGNSAASPGEFTSLLSRLSAGDTLFCRGGQYDYSSTIDIAKNGTATKMVCIFNYPEETPVFDFRREAYGSRGIVIKSGSSYIHIKGLTIRYTGKNGLHNSGSNCIFELLDVYGNGDTGIQMKAGGNNLILNCDSHDNFDYMLANDFGGNADGFADKQYEGGGNIYRNCRAWNNSDDGWDFYQRVNTAGTVTVLENCICYQNGPVEYDMRNHPRYETDKNWFDQFANGQNVTFRKGNTAFVTLEHYYNNGNQNGFKLGGAYTNNVVRLVRCLAVGNGARGFDQNNNAGTMELYNCSAYQNGSDYSFTNSSYGTLTIKNCLTVAGSHDLSCKQVIESHNSWSISGVTCDESDFESLDDSYILADRQDDGSLGTAPFMQLVEGSDLIDCGEIIEGVPYGGSAPDLGCYEYAGVNYPATLTCLTGNTSQAVKEGQPIAEIIMKWGGDAIGAETYGLPAELSEVVNEQAKTITIKGSLSLPGTYEFVVRTLQAPEISGAELSCAISVREDLGTTIAYVTVPNSGADAPLLQSLQEVFNVEVKDASLSNQDYSAFDLIVISSVPTSSLQGVLELKGIDKPVVLLKPFLLKNGAWGWGTAKNTSDMRMKVIMPEHPIFDNVEITDGQLEFFSTVSTNGVTLMDSWNDSPQLTEIATPVSMGGQSIFELPVGGTYSGTTLTHPLLCIGLSEYSLSNITFAGRQVVINACYHLLGKTPTGIGRIDNDDKEKAYKVYDLSGRQLHNENVLKKGIYIKGNKKYLKQ